MAQGTLINDFRPVYSENVLPLFSDFESTSIINKTSGSATSGAIFTSLKNYDGTQCIMSYNDDILTPLVFNFGSNLSKTITKTGTYIFSFELLHISAPVFNDILKVNIYVDGLLTESIENGLVNNDTGIGIDKDKWHCFAQSFILSAGQVVDFTFEHTCAPTGFGFSTIYFDALKLEYDDRNLGTPSIYSKPLDNSINYRFYTGWGNYLDTQKTIGTPLNLVAGVDTPLRIRANTYNETQLPIDVDTFYLAGNLAVTAVTGTFVEGDTLTGGTSGATAYLKRINTVSNFGLHNYVGDFTGTETITGSISGATASFSSLSNGYITGRNGDSIDFMLYFKVVPSATNAELDIWIDIGGGVGELYRDTKYYRGTTEKGVIYTIPSGYTLDTWEANGGVIYLKSSVNMTVYLVSINVDRSHKAR